MCEPDTLQLLTEIADEIGIRDARVIEESAAIVDSVKMLVVTSADLRQVAFAVLVTVDRLANGKPDRKVFQIGTAARALFIGVSSRIIAGTVDLEMSDLEEIWDAFRAIVESL